MAAEHSDAAHTDCDTMAKLRVLPDCAAVSLSEAITGEATPAQPIAKATDGLSNDGDEFSEPAPEVTIDAAPAEAPKVPFPAKPSQKTFKSALVQKLLSRARGATLGEMEEATGWQAHSVRAYLTGLRKKNLVLVRETRKDNVSAYRVANQSWCAAESRHTARPALA